MLECWSADPRGVEHFEQVLHVLKRGQIKARFQYVDMGLSENMVYSQGNSHLIGIMIINHWV